MAHRIAVVTGASGGVGRATAQALAARDFHVALIARGQVGLDAAARDVEAHGRRALKLRVDVADCEQVEAAAARVERELGPIDVWINNAMTTAFQRVVETSAADFRRAIEVTFLGQVWGTMAALRRMRQRDHGTIVNVGSALAFIGIPLQAPYCASKFACRGFTQSVRAELMEEGSNIRVAMVHLPAVNTPQFDWCQTDQDRQPQPVPPIYQPEVAAEFIVRAALDGRRSKVLGSWNKLVVAAASLAPGVGNQFAAITGASSQLTDQPVKPDRPSNLKTPADDEADYGAHGQFDDRAAGATHPTFVRSVPHTAAQFARATGRSWRDRFHSLRQRARDRS
jgi:short-subunit dehydrogenase